MSGNFDFPPASSSSNPPVHRDSFPARIQELRQVFQRERERTRVHLEAEAAHRREHRESPSMPPRRARSSRPTPRIPSWREMAARNAEQNASAAPPAPPESVTNSLRRRPRANPSDRFSSLRRLRQHREQSNSLTELQEAGERLAQLSSNLTSLLDEPLQLPDISRLEAPTEPDNDRPRLKRRKLDHDSNDTGFQAFKYGYFGQVVPGRLKMEIVSCDGGEYSADSTALYRAENVLRNDKSVYCTKSSRCNLVLGHQGETTFDLQKLVIKAPGRGFTAPVQEGMIFVSMTQDKLLSSTSQYEIQYLDPSSAPPLRSVPARDREEQLTLLESLRDPEVQAAYSRRASQLRQAQRPRGVARPRSHEDLFLPTVSDNSNSTYDVCDWPAFRAPAQPSTPRVDLPPITQPFTVSTDTDDEPSDEDESSAATIADRLRRDSRWRPQSDSDTDEDEEMRPLNRYWAERMPAGPLGYVRAIQRTAPSRFQVREAPGAAGEVGEEVPAPHARFFIEKGKSRITVRFDPPVSGKFILLKLWSPLAHGGNIDIQSVTAYGFAGPSEKTEK
ncbi:hypothetical protein H2201_005398 [Coniosporium apollinis]|uniref:FHA domain-containing protein n=1 Tax=Coniosporium apollinis TaxID=61459 RepID=A0ABQ9NPX0_9PEZI|nr:hypothetical protein H2201_005398 [Coniosporium apollinis]